jgi:hypothetical protein
MRRNSLLTIICNYIRCGVAKPKIQDSHMKYVSILKELFDFMMKRKKWWLTTLIIILIIIGILILISDASVIAPFIYTIF